MNRKYNPWLSLVALMLLALILAFTCTGCSVQEDATELEPLAETEDDHPARFSVTSENHGGVNIRVITDTSTGKEYIVVQSGYAGITKLEG